MKNPFLRRKARTRYRIKQRSKGVPRLSVFRSARHIYAQIIDDTSSHTLVCASSLESKETLGNNCASATKVGQILAGRAKEKGIAKVVFDRGGCLYHGRVRALADSARESGLQL